MTRKNIGEWIRVKGVWRKEKGECERVDDQEEHRRVDGGGEECRGKKGKGNCRKKGRERNNLRRARSEKLREER